MKGIYAYVNFDGNCREAMEFYSRCLGAELQLTPFSETESRILHARLSKGSALLMAGHVLGRALRHAHRSVRNPMDAEL